MNGAVYVEGVAVHERLICVDAGRTHYWTILDIAENNALCRQICVF